MKGAGLVLLAAVATVAMMAASAASGQPARSLDTLQFNAVFSVVGLPAACPSGTAATAVCFQFSGHATIPGLGEVTDSHLLISADDSTLCVPLSSSPDVLSVAGKGEIDSSIALSASCNGLPPTAFAVTGGAGAYAGASGSGTFTAVLADDGDDAAIDKDDLNAGDWSHETLSGSLTVPGLSFDTSPPTISGATSLHVKTKNTRGAKVSYALTASDPTDGSLPVSCTPASGSRFPLGHTPVSCSATDKDGNTATASFTVTVSRSRRH